MFGADNPKSVSVTIDDVVYSTLTEASLKTGINRLTIRYRQKSEKFINYR